MALADAGSVIEMLPLLALTSTMPALSAVSVVPELLIVVTLPPDTRFTACTSCVRTVLLGVIPAAARTATISSWTAFAQSPSTTVEGVTPGTPTWKKPLAFGPTDAGVGRTVAAFALSMRYMMPR